MDQPGTHQRGMDRPAASLQQGYGLATVLIFRGYERIVVAPSQPDVLPAAVGNSGAWVFIQGCVHDLQKFRVPGIVCIQKGGIHALRIQQSTVSGNRGAGVGLTGQPEARVCRGKSLQFLPGGIGGAVVDNDQLPVASGLGEHAANTLR